LEPIDEDEALAALESAAARDPAVREFQRMLEASS
jgi:hypothetical protein